jgi:hypothetical protein
MQKWSYYLHTDENMETLLTQNFPEFPMLNSITSHCLNKNSSLRQDLWSFLLLWEFGGLYVHFDYSIGSFDTSTISNNFDGFFFIDPETNELSTKVFAVSKNHPLMYHAIQRMIGNILSPKDINNKYTGVSALNQAFHDFWKGSKGQNDSEVIDTGHYVGAMERSIDVIDYLGFNQYLLIPTHRDQSATKADLEDIGSLIHPYNDTEEYSSIKNCFRELYRKKLQST